MEPRGQGGSGLASLKRKTRELEGQVAKIREKKRLEEERKLKKLKQESATVLKSSYMQTFSRYTSGMFEALRDYKEPDQISGAEQSEGFSPQAHEEAAAAGAPGDAAPQHVGKLEEDGKEVIDIMGDKADNSMSLDSSFVLQLDGESGRKSSSGRGRRGGSSRVRVYKRGHSHSHSRGLRTSHSTDGDNNKMRLAGQSESEESDDGSVIELTDTGYGYDHVVVDGGTDSNMDVEDEERDGMEGIGTTQALDKSKQDNSHNHAGRPHLLDNAGYESDSYTPSDTESPTSDSSSFSFTSSLPAAPYHSPTHGRSLRRKLKGMATSSGNVYVDMGLNVLSPEAFGRTKAESPNNNNNNNTLSPEAHTLSDTLSKTEEIECFTLAEVAQRFVSVNTSKEVQELKTAVREAAGRVDTQHRDLVVLRARVRAIEGLVDAYNYETLLESIVEERKSKLEARGKGKVGTQEGALQEMEEENRRLREKVEEMQKAVDEARTKLRRVRPNIPADEMAKRLEAKRALLYSSMEGMIVNALNQVRPQCDTSGVSDAPKAQTD